GTQARVLLLEIVDSLFHQAVGGHVQDFGLSESLEPLEELVVERFRIIDPLRLQQHNGLRIDATVSEQCAAILRQDQCLKSPSPRIEDRLEVLEILREPGLAEACQGEVKDDLVLVLLQNVARSEEHTSEL